MKRSIIILITLHCSLFTLHSLYAQDFEIKAYQNAMDYLVIEVRETSGNGTPTITTDITDLQFEIRWPQSYGSDLDASLICDSWSLVEGLGARQSEGTYYWRVFAAQNVPFSPATNWVQNQWETIGMFRIIATGSSGGGAFEIPADTWVVQGLNIGIDGKDYTPGRQNNVSALPYPSQVYEFVWKGGNTQLPDYDEQSWTLGANWEDPCGMEYAPTTVPSAGFSCFIPAGLTYYPANFNITNSGTCDRLRMETGADLAVPSGAILQADQLLLENTSDLTVETGGEVHIEQ